jgi:signal transduction histidine kinase/CheY-like chemotaxis protein
MESSRRRLLMWVGAVFAVVNAIGPLIALFTLPNLPPVYWLTNIGSSVSLAFASLAAYRGQVRVAAGVIGFFASATPLFLAYTSLPPPVALLTTAFATVGITIAATFGRASVAALVTALALIAILALPSFRSEIPIRMAIITAFLVLLTSSLAAVSIRMREQSARALARAADAAARSEATFRAIAETAPVPILMVSLRDKDVRFANPPASRYLDDADELSAILDELKSSDEVREREIQLGDTWLSVNARRLRRDDEDDEDIALCALYDITTHMQATAALVDARDAAEVTSRTRTNFLANISHELRTPLNGVLGMLRLLVDTPLSTEQQAIAARARRSADSLLHMIDGVLDFAKIDAGRIELESIEVDLEDVVFSALELLTERAQDKGVELAATLDASAPARVRGDPTRLRQVLLNLVANAVKFTEVGSVVVRASATVEDESVALRLEVEDTGIGIEPEDQLRLFDAFQQADPSTTRKHGGTGLGLAIVRELIELMGGRVDLRSVPGEGTTVFVDVRLGRVDEPAPPPLDVDVAVSLSGARSAELARETLATLGARLVRLDEATVVVADGAVETSARVVRVAPMTPLRPSDLRLAITNAQRPAEPALARRGKLLLAEDNETNQLVARHVLERLGYEVEVVPNGEVCVERATREAADYVAILMDCQMPVLDGLAATERIRATENGERIPIVALTAHDTDQERCFAAGMDGYLKKPLRPERLEQELDRISVR